MKNRDALETYVYRIDRHDRIVSVSENWTAFAAENEGLETCHPKVVLHRSLWDFIQDDETRHLYGIVIDKVRSTGLPVAFPFRCDSPEMRRRLELEILPQGGGSLEFRSTVLETESREPQDLLKRNARPSSGAILTICSMCKKVRLPSGGWREVEEAVASLGLFDEAQLPDLSHGVCPACHAHALETLDGLSADKQG